MRSLIVATLVGIAAASAGCAHTHAPTEADQGFKFVHPDQLQKMQASGTVAVYDANLPAFRAQNGVVPGARMLSSADAYDTAKELPANKQTPLVFYCVNQH